MLAVDGKRDPRRVHNSGLIFMGSTGDIVRVAHATQISLAAQRLYKVCAVRI
jgi:hypothetical protein